MSSAWPGAPGCRGLTGLPAWRGPSLARSVDDRSTIGVDWPPSGRATAGAASPRGGSGRPRWTEGHAWTRRDARCRSGRFAVDDSETARYEIVKDVVDELIDLTLNERQSGHPGGSRSKVHFVLGTLLCGAMRWDVLRPWRTFSDRFVLSAGHTVPLVYAILATLNEGMRARHALDGDERFAFPDDGRWALTWEDLLTFRHRGGLPGHAEMAGKTLLFKANTGPSGHGMPVAAGEALALKMAGCRGGQGLRRGRGGRPDARRHPRDRSTPPGAWASATSSSSSTGTTSASTRAPHPPSSTARRRTGSARTAGARWARRTAWPGSRSCARPWRRRAVTTRRACPRWPGSARRRVAATASRTPPPTASRMPSTARPSGPLARASRPATA